MHPEAEGPSSSPQALSATLRPRAFPISGLILVQSVRWIEENGPYTLMYLTACSSLGGGVWEGLGGGVSLDVSSYAIPS